MSKSKEKKPHVSLKIAIMTVSDTRDESTDTSGQLLVERVASANHIVADKKIVRDEPELIRRAVGGWLGQVDVIVSTGGTGLTLRDVTADVFEALYEKRIPGFGELFRQLSYADIGTSTIQSRASGGIARGTLLFALPGSPGAVRLAWDEILVYQLDVNQRPCNLVEILGRIREE